MRAVPQRDGGKRVALTYDDGPSPSNTQALLDLLAAHDAHATFFVVGREVDRHPELAAAIRAAGHELGNHSTTHPNPLDVDSAALVRDFAACDDSIRGATGASADVLRPPYGKRAAEIAGLVDARVVLWSVDSGDTAGFGAERIAREVVRTVEPGGIVLMHDGGSRRDATLDATQLVLSELTQHGYEFVTVSELLDHARPD